MTVTCAKCGAEMKVAGLYQRTPGSRKEDTGSSGIPPAGMFA